MTVSVLNCSTGMTGLKHAWLALSQLSIIGTHGFIINSHDLMLLLLSTSASCSMHVRPLDMFTQVATPRKRITASQLSTFIKDIILVGMQTQPFHYRSNTFPLLSS